MSKLKQQISDFTLSGKLVGFVIKDGYKIKYLRIGVAEQEYWLKLPKKMRQSFNTEIIPGCWLDVTGTKKQSKTGKVKLEATEVKLADASVPKLDFNGTLAQNFRGAEAGNNRAGNGVSKGSKVAPTRILVCRKSSCQKKGPNLVVLPDKARYSRVTPEQVPELLARHL